MKGAQLGRESRADEQPAQIFHLILLRCLALRPRRASLTQALGLRSTRLPRTRLRWWPTRRLPSRPAWMSAMRMLRWRLRGWILLRAHVLYLLSADPELRDVVRLLGRLGF